MKLTQFLTATIILGLMLPDVVDAQSGADSDVIIKPKIERRDVRAPHIDAQDFEAGVFFGVLSVENFGSNSVSGVRLAYHIDEHFFVEGVYGKSEVSDTVFRREASKAVLPNETEDLSYYNLSAGVNLFPGDSYLLGRWAVSSAVYVKAGIGITDFVDDRQTFNIGLGIRLMATDWLGFHIDIEDLIFESDILAGQNNTTHNFQLHAGATVFF